MHVAMVICGGLVLLALFLLFEKSRGGAPPAFARAAWVFIPVWLALALVNMWVGVTRAGYTVAEEAPILLLVFAVPAGAALLVARQCARRPLG